VVRTEITPQMTSKWVKAAFLILLGIVLLVYSDGLVDDLERNAAEEFNVSFEWTWELVRILLWILVAWLFVDAVLIIVLSFKGDAYTLTDVMARLKAIEKNTAPLKVRTAAAPVTVTPTPEPVAQTADYPVAEEMPDIPDSNDEEPPPPLE
jgi:hypothetical protein